MPTVFPRTAYYQKLFFAAALWNWLLAGGDLLLQLTEVLFTDNALQAGWVFQTGFSCFAFIFGFGYYWLSRDIHSNHGIIKMAVMGKVMVGVLFAVDYWYTDGPLLPAIIGAGDLLFGLLFIEFLRAYRAYQLSPDPLLNAK